MKNILSGIIALLIFTGVNYSQTPSFRIFPSDSVHQTEPLIVVSPLNPMIMFATAATFDTISVFRSEGVYLSTNGGLNWTGTNTCNGTPINNHGGDPGIAIDRYGIFILSHIGYAQPNGVFAHYSTNMGANWSAAYTISLTSQNPPEDKGTLTTDNSPSSPFFGRTYISGVNYVSPYPVLLAYTTNSGLNWSSYTAINNPPPGRCSGGDVETGPDGEVYDAWARVSATLPNTEINAGFGYSSDGGVNWTINQNVFAMNGINGVLTSKDGIRVNGLPKLITDISNSPRRGWVYMFTTEKNNAPAGSDPDILMHRSTNKGQTWSVGIRVNQDPVNNGKIQYFPAPCVDSTGAVNVLYYDDRNTSSDSAEVYMSRSTDGGNTWYDFVVSDRRFQPRKIFGSGYQGDFICMTSTRNKLFPVWMANYSGKYQIWTTIIDINAIGIQKISSEVPKNFLLSQNYPNPFNPVTKIRFQVPPSKGSGGMILAHLAVFDVLGKEVTTLVNQQLFPGEYEVEWNALNYPSGVYYYRLISGEFSFTKKMVLLK